MPDNDTTIPATTDSAPAVDTASAAPADTSASNDAVYDTAAAEMLGTTSETPVTAAKVETPDQGQAPAAPAANPVVTDGVRHVLSRAGFKEEFVAGWDASRVNDFVAYLTKSQAEQDKLGAELGRYKQPEKPEAKPEAKPEKAAPSQTPRSERIRAVREKLIEDAGEEFAPVFDLLNEMDSESAAYQQQLGTVNVMADVVTEMLVDMSIQRIAADYPSVNKPESRKQLEDRFWVEWNTGAYAKPGVSFREQISAALNNAAKVTFINTTEQSAAANLVNTNRARVATQPKTGHAAPHRSGPATADDVYDRVYAETMGG